ncbi:MAG: GNAT family N-acetyltransferase [Myxococcales bacterium]|nr:GNAT family N-acetyltransferase [Myxococcales bacterium]MCB9733175.1 GNAT family N-acetyltransferase [Deltaproteobacteria bacterium]
MLVLDLTPFPVLTTERLVLREPTLDDVDALFAMRSDPEVARYTGKHPDTDREVVRALIETMRARNAANTSVQRAVALREAPDVLIGVCGLWQTKLEHYRGELGYSLARAHWGRGYAREAVAATVAHAFDVLGFHSVEAVVAPGNAASIRVLEVCGFVREAYFREDFFFDGKFEDSAVYGRLTPHRGALGA